MHRFVFSFLTAIALTAMPLATPAAAEEEPIYQTLFGTAINGFDAVAYFTEGRPVEGKSDHSLKWQGAKWRFISAQNRDAFAADPEKYAPQYGGYDAWAISQGYTAMSTPHAWRMVDGKLYLLYSPSVRKRWEKHMIANIEDADRNWPGVLR